MTIQTQHHSRLCPLDSTANLERKFSTIGDHGGGPVASHITLSPEIVGEEHYAVASEVKRVLQRCHELQDIIAILGMDELSDEEKTRLYYSRFYNLRFIAYLRKLFVV